MPSRWTRHIVVALGFAAFAVVWTWPLTARLFTHLPGDHTGDNMTFLWNFWWMRTALAEGIDVFRTTHLFAPFGADLTLHTYGPLASFVGATVLGGLPLAAALNLTVLGTLTLNGWCTYLLAWRLTRDRGAAIVAGLVFAASPYIAVRLAGHFNLLAAWPLPLVALAALEARRGSTAWALGAGAVIGLTMYVDYYYVVYASVLAAGLLAAGWFDLSLTIRGATPASRRWAGLVAMLALADVVLIAGVLVSGGGVFELGPVRLSMSSVFNPLQVFWLLLAIWIWLRVRPRLRLARRVDARVAARVTVVVAMTAAVVAAPIVWNAIELILRGDYSTQPHFWRSGPPDIDPATLVFGPPAHGLVGSWVGRRYDAFEIHIIESVGWLALVPLGLAALAIRQGRHGQVTFAGATRLWTAVGLCFFIWALGSHLMIAGVNTGMVLPQAFFQYVPILNNARMPGRAIVVTHLALAMLAAIALSQWRPRAHGRALPLVAAMVAIGLESLPAPLPLVSLEPPPIVAALRDRPEPGAVLDLPLGVHDGFGGPGAVDQRAPYHQTVHGRPVLGGYLSRVPDALENAYRSDPVLSALMGLSEPDGATERAAAPLPDRETMAARLKELGVAFVLIDRRTAPPALVDYVLTTLPVTEIDRDEHRTLYLLAR